MQTLEDHFETVIDDQDQILEAETNDLAHQHYLKFYHASSDSTW